MFRLSPIIYFGLGRLITTICNMETWWRKTQMLSWLHISSNLDTAFSFTFFQHIFDLSKDNIKQKKKSEWKLVILLLATICYNIWSTVILKQKKKIPGFSWANETRESVCLCLYVCVSIFVLLKIIFHPSWGKILNQFFFFFLRSHGPALVGIISCFIAWL